jgi:hypothetical protein
MYVNLLVNAKNRKRKIDTLKIKFGRKDKKKTQANKKEEEISVSEEETINLKIQVFKAQFAIME